MFTPTKQELEELGFIKKNYYFYYFIQSVEQSTFYGWPVELRCYQELWFQLRIQSDSDHSDIIEIDIYPRSLSDLKTIISSFTPN